MSMGAVLFRTGEIRGSHLGGLYKTMPWTTGFCIVGAASISAFPLFSGFISKSIIITEAARNDHTLIWLCLLFASAGVFHHAGIKIPFSLSSPMTRVCSPKEAPVNMLIAMGISSFLCIFLGCNYRGFIPCCPMEPLDILPMTQLTRSPNSRFCFSPPWLSLCSTWGKYPKELPSVNLDVDWFYRKAGRFFLKSTSIFWNGLNDRVHSVFIGKVVTSVNEFAKSGKSIFSGFSPIPCISLAFGNESATETKAKLVKRADLGLHQVGLTAFAGLLFLLLFLILA